MSKAPTNQRRNSRGRAAATAVEPGSAFAQFAYAPAIETTVVTTIKKTTTKFPPFIVRPPKRAGEVDKKQYPLASAPTPVALKNIRFSINGKPATFREAEDTSIAIQDMCEEYQSLDRFNEPTQYVQYSHVSADPPSPADFERRPRLASPDSITGVDDEADTVGQWQNTPQTIELPNSTAMGSSTAKRQSLRRLSSHPNTPLSRPNGSRQRAGRRHESASGTNSYSNIEPAFPSPRPDGQSARLTPSQRQQPSRLERQRFAEPDGADLQDQSVVPTPPVETEERRCVSGSATYRPASAAPARISVTGASPGQDGSLPSPSLSPITAAASLQQPGYFEDIDSNSELASQPGQETWSSSISHNQAASRSREPTPLALEGGLNTQQSTVSDINAMLGFFDGIPDELKSYVMYQMLRRCPKSTLHVVADAVNPALKCDFLTRLPLELALNTLKYLDVRSLCKAAQVSKRWRQMINGDEDTWKRLFDADGLTMPKEEMEKAVAEGWGWQDPHGPAGFERDISTFTFEPSGSEGVLSSVSTIHDAPQASRGGTLRRSKRKAATALTNRNKQARRTRNVSASTPDAEIVDWISQLSTAEGPSSAVCAAAVAVPYAHEGLQSLRGLHLYKSLYRRHHMIRRNWLYEDTKPHHIAFRAHDRHVVTCLQFDTDKILTGSDDNNIHVYDTKTGALKAQLEGHEGGVWALHYEGNTLVSGSTDRSVRVWDIERGVETHVFRGHTSTVRCLQIVQPVKVREDASGKPVMVPKRPQIITGSRDSTLRVWYLPQPGESPYIQPENVDEETPNRWFVRTLTGHAHSVRAIAAHADTLVSGSYDSSVRVWNISTGETVWRLTGHTAKVYSVVLDHQRNRCISGSMDNTVKIWSLDTGSLTYTLEGHSSLVGLLDLNCERLVSAAADSTLRIWDPENGHCKATLTAHTGAITCFQHDAQKVISGSDRTLKMWNVKTGECIKDLLSDLSGVWQVKFNERRCVAAVQRDHLTYIEVLDFGAARDGVPDWERGRRIVVDVAGREFADDDERVMGLDGEVEG